MTPKKQTQAFQILISLDLIKPAIWRRVLVSEKVSLLDLHDVIQRVFPWQDYHLHEFVVHGHKYGDSETDERETADILDERNYTLQALDLDEGSQIRYQYDFGDTWNHTLVIEKKLPVEKGMKLPACLAGERACPPEDVGGISGYEEFVTAISDPQHPEHDNLLQWIGGSYDPTAFNLEATNAALRQAPARDWFGRLPPVVEEEARLAREQLDPINWAKLRRDDWESRANELPFRKDVATLLGYIMNNKVTGTQSTGNLPRKAVVDIASRFVDPPNLEENLGGQIFHTSNNEDEVWPVYFTHVMAQGAALVTGGPGRKWQVTSLGEDYLDLPAVAQVWDLFITWWYHINWKIALPYEEFSDLSPDDLRKVTARLLKGFPIEQPIEFSSFVDKFYEAAGLPLLEGDPDRRQIIRQAAVDQMILDPLEGFGVLMIERVPDTQYKIEILKATSFRVTEFGMNLLSAV